LDIGIIDILQTEVKKVQDPLLEPIFGKDSYGYRPGKSAVDAIEIKRKHC